MQPYSNNQSKMMQLEKELDSYTQQLLVENDHYKRAELEQKIAVIKDEINNSQGNNFPQQSPNADRIYPENKKYKMFPYIKKKSNRYICVLHFPMISAWITPTSYPVRKYTVVYNGEYNHGYLTCKCEKQQLKIKVGKVNITLKFISNKETDIVKIPYVMNKICKYQLDICDAMESWEFIISDFPISHETYKSGYEYRLDAYYNTKDIEEERKLQNRIRTFYN